MAQPRDNLLKRRVIEYVSRIYINDINRSIHAFWDTVLNDTEPLCRRIRDTRVSVAEWRRQRAVQSDASASMGELAFSTFFLNRTNRSGIIGGGIIGGKQQTGQWGLDARYNKSNLIRRIQRIAAIRHRITLYRRDAADLIVNVLPALSERCFVYLDPPYYAKGKELYEDHYNPSDHKKIASLVRGIEQHWMVSYDNEPVIRRLYTGYRRQHFGLYYTAQSRYQGSEIAFFSDKLAIPGRIRAYRGEAL
jgi:DNA adenine methylase